jgi:hypothetical protein
MILEDGGGRIAINPDKFDKLITSLRTAVDDDEVLDKEATSYNDIFDAFRLVFKFYHFEDSGSVFKNSTDPNVKLTNSSSSSLILLRRQVIIHESSYF